MLNIRLPDPLSQPGAPGFTSVRMNDNNPVFRDRLPGGKVITLSSSAQYWGVTLSYEDLLAEEYNIILSTMLDSRQSGALIDVLLPHKQSYKVKGDTSVLTVASDQKGSVLQIGNYNLTGLPALGDIFRLSNHCSKVYTIHGVSIIDSTLKLSVYPNLMKITTGAEKVLFTNVLFQLALENPSELTNNFAVEGIYNSFQVELAESITYDA
jgi:hypothetical protein